MWFDEELDHLPRMKPVLYLSYIASYIAKRVA